MELPAKRVFSEECYIELTCTQEDYNIDDGINECNDIVGDIKEILKTFYMKGIDSLQGKLTLSLTIYSHGQKYALTRSLDYMQCKLWYIHDDNSGVHVQQHFDVQALIDFMTSKSRTVFIESENQTGGFEIKVSRLSLEISIGYRESNYKHSIKF